MVCGEEAGPGGRRPNRWEERGDGGGVEASLEATEGRRRGGRREEDRPSPEEEEEEKKEVKD